ncbi:MAG: 2'-5' RNA ligase family protein, partial [Candidatus Hydrogenedentes bacterium]|nr:2'-5' RNA ligase family protein [Candidatus Hydrogenedentota bacterium]
MGYAVELFINEHEAMKLRETISAIGSVMADIGATPHVSLAVFDDVDVNSLVSVVADFVMRTPKIVLQFSSVGMFPGRENVLFLAPVVTRDLLVIHAGLHQDLAELGLFADANYRPGKWVPHCTLSMEQPLE